jgi:hypothetical protein
MEAPTSHATRIYGAEHMALRDHKERFLDRATATELSTRMIGMPVTIVDLPDKGLEQGYTGCAIWFESKPYVALEDITNISDLLLSHEVAHLVADSRGIQTGHGLVWIKSYLGILREWGRPECANAIREWVGPVALNQPITELSAAST